MKRVVIMGGNEAYNDWTSTGAEFNFYCDPDAAEEVIRKVLCAVSTFVQHACSRHVNVQAGSCMLVPQSACAVLLITSVIFFLTATVCIQHIAVLSIIVYCRVLHLTAAAHVYALYVTQSFVFHTILRSFLQFAGKTTLLTWECMQRNPLPQSLARALVQKVVH